MPENPRIEELRRRVLADPASIAFAALAEEFRRVGALSDAIETCRAGLLRHPAYLSARVTLGRALIETGDYDAAREELETVLRSAPENLAAIRGLAQINERLGHSTEMDPHLAELMREEAARVAALPAPVPEPVPEPEPLPEPVLEALPPDHGPQPEPNIVFAPSETEPAIAADAEPEPKREPEPEPVGFPATSFSLPAPSSQLPASRLALEPDPERACEIQGEPEPEAEPVFTVQLEPEPVTEPERSEILVATPEREPGPDNVGFPAPRLAPPAPHLAPRASRLALDPALEPESGQVLDAAALPEPAFDLAIAPELGPDPQVLATLARLERFLAAVETARHA